MSTERESLFPFVPLDRYCFAPCIEQLTEGECDCTRRIAREAAAALDKDNFVGRRIYDTIKDALYRAERAS